MPQQQDWFSQFEAPIPRKAKESQDWFSQFEAKQPQEAEPSNLLSDIPRRIFYGATNEEMGLPEETKIVGTPNEESFLPKFKQPSSYLGGFANSLYEDYIRPLGSEAFALGQSMPGKLPPLWGGGVSKIGPLAAPQSLNKRPVRALLEQPVTRELKPGARFVGGPAGLAEYGKTYPLDVTGSELPQGKIGTVLPRETGEVTQLSAEDAARLGLKAGAGEIPKISLPKKGEVINLNELNRRIGAIRERPTQIGEPPDYNIGRVAYPSEQPSAPVKPSRFATKSTTPKAGQESVKITQSQAGKVVQPLAPITSTTAAATKAIETGERPIAASASPEEAARNWANGFKNEAPYRGNIVKEDFADLTDPALIDRYEQGDRTGRLKDVEKFFEQRWQQSRQLGFLEEDQKRLNYLRHYFEQSPEKVTAAYKAYIAKNPQFAKLGKFPTYSVAEKAGGLTKKFNTIPEIMGAYETEYQKALRNKEFYDYLKNSKQLASGAITTKPTEWTFTGPNAKELKKYVTNIFSESPDWIKSLGGLGSYAKNLFLGSGVPGTPLNMHYYNTMKSRFYAEGTSGLANYLKGTFSPQQDMDYLKSKRGFIADLLGRGFQHNIEGHTTFGNAVQEAGKANKLVEFAKNVRDWQGKIFEDPLFKIHLPAQKVQLAENIYKDALKQGLDNESALKQAASISNDVMGGIDRSLRHATTKDLLQFGLVAPDWLESRYNMAVKGIKALAGKESPIYAKALGRKLAVGGIGVGATAAIAGQATNPSKRASNITSIPAGKTSTGLNREIPIYGTTAEEIRIPAELIKAATTQGQSLGERLSGLATGRINAPAKVGLNLLMNRDYTNTPIYGRDRFGKPIPPGQQILNIGKELARPFTPPWLPMMEQIVTGEDLERAVAQGVELPINYNREPPTPGMRKMRKLSK